jgi:hypothetical protein
MPTWVEEDLDGINEVIENGGLAPATKRRQAQCEKHFEEFLTRMKHPSLDQLLMNKDHLQSVLICFMHIEEPDDDEDTSEEHALCIMSQADKENHQENRKGSMDVFESLIRREQQLAAIYEIKTAKAHQSLAIAHREGSAKRMKLIQELLVQKKI